MSETITTTFRIAQKEAIERGKLNRNRLKQLVMNISAHNGSNKYPHTYIFSPPGLGKTYSVQQHLDQSKVRYIKVSGNVSMFAFGIQLAVINYMNPKHERIVVFVDDCDEIFRNDINCNTMKNVLDGEKIFSYEKSLSSQMRYLTELQMEAINYFGSSDKLGYRVPTDNLVFVFTSNFKLPVDDEVETARRKGLSKTTLLAHRNAIRSRCKVGDFDLDWKDHWGWISDVVLNTDCLTHFDVNEMQKEIILNFMWNNWRHLTERSIRLIEKMAQVIKEDPDNFYTIWEIDFLKKS